MFPATHFIAICRGIIIRGACFWDFWPRVVVFLVLVTVLVPLCALAFRKPIS